MHKLIIIRGNSGSGKTTIAEKLQKKFGRNTITADKEERTVSEIYNSAQAQARAKRKLYQ